MRTGTEPTHGAEPGRGHETRDVNIRFITSVVIGLFLLTLLGMGVSRWFQAGLAERQRAAERPRSPLAESLPTQPPEPRLQVRPAADLVELRAREEAQLTRYEWIDPNQGLVRIPVERAIELLAERGLPARAQPGQKSAAAR